MMLEWPSFHLCYKHLEAQQLNFESSVIYSRLSDNMLFFMQSLLLQLILTGAESCSQLVVACIYLKISITPVCNPICLLILLLNTNISYVYVYFSLTPNLNDYSECTHHSSCRITL